ncbi:hypothetical protein BHE74_00035059 [Ensete ventricosum]|nr:hypothetical protein BHE74_00035059 [Ensete ventricosum]
MLLPPLPLSLPSDHLPPLVFNTHYLPSLPTIGPTLSPSSPPMQMSSLLSTAAAHPYTATDHWTLVTALLFLCQFIASVFFRSMIEIEQPLLLLLQSLDLLFLPLRSSYCQHPLPYYRSPPPVVPLPFPTDADSTATVAIPMPSLMPTSSFPYSLSSLLPSALLLPALAAQPLPVAIAEALALLPFFIPHPMPTLWPLLFPISSCSPCSRRSYCCCLILHLPFFFLLLQSRPPLQ